MMRRTIVILVMMATLCFAVVVTRAFLEGRQALVQAQEAHSKGNMEQAIRLWRRAARWYVPFASHVALAYDQLHSIALQAQDKGDVKVALAAWRGIRSSILSTRSTYTPYIHLLEPANRHIAALMAALETSDRNDQKTAKVHQSVEERTDWHYQLLARDESPSVFWSIVALLGFSLWIGGGILFAIRGVTKDDRLVVSTASYCGALVACGLVIWMLGLYKA